MQEPQPANQEKHHQTLWHNSILAYDSNRIQAQEAREHCKEIPRCNHRRCDQPSNRRSGETQPVLSTRRNTGTIQRGLYGHVRGSDMAGAKGV